MVGFIIFSGTLRLPIHLWMSYLPAAAQFQRWKRINRPGKLNTDENNEKETDIPCWYCYYNNELVKWELWSWHISGPLQYYSYYYIIDPIVLNDIVGMITMVYVWSHLEFASFASVMRSTLYEFHINLYVLHVQSKVGHNWPHKIAKRLFFSIFLSFPVTRRFSYERAMFFFILSNIILAFKETTNYVNNWKRFSMDTKS